MDMKKPNLFIVGEPKCGTSPLFVFLEKHPEIFMPGGTEPNYLKEPNYFNKDLHEESDEFHGKQKCYPFRKEEQYLELFKDAKDEKILGEGTTNYLYSKDAAKNIHAFNPDAKIIIMIRDPVAFLHSLHLHFVFELDDDVEDLREALALENERKKGNHIPKTIAAPSLLYYSERAKFSEHIKRFYDVFKRDQIKVIIMEEFRNDTAKIYREVLKFLGVDPDFTPIFVGGEHPREIRFKFLKKYMLSSYFSVKFLRAVLPKKAFNLARHGFFTLTGKPGKKPKLDDNVRKELMKKYKGEVERLSRLLNKNLILLWGYNKI